ncbi:hypothetical protein SxD43FB_22705 [Sphingobium sp. D43FB]|nr:hypothetical protein SxD43FB_22705 [Sphingobium sp. D43FB]
MARQKALTTRLKALDKGRGTQPQSDALQTWITSDDVYYELENSKYRRREKSGEWQLISGPALLATRPEDVMAGEETIKRTLRSMGRVVARAAYLEDTAESDILNMMDFSGVLPPVHGEAYHWIFDVLVQSLAGIDGDEGAHYIERWIVVRYNLIRQRKSGAYRMSALVLDNDDGGAGKNVFVERCLSTLFGKRLVAGNMRIAELTGDYNDSLRGKAVAMVNEVSFDRTDTERLKQILGSKTLRVNPKHQAIRQDDNTTAFILSGNAYGRTVKLTGTSIDRRYSVMMSDFKLALLIAQHEGMDIQADTFDRDIDRFMDDVLTILDAPGEVARWIGALVGRYGEATTIEPFHRLGYQRALEVQESPFSAFLIVAFNDDFQACSVSGLHEAYRRYAVDWVRERDILTQRAFVTAAKRFGEKRFPNFFMRKAGTKDPVTGSQSNWFFAAPSLTVSDDSMADIERRL